MGLTLALASACHRHKTGESDLPKPIDDRPLASFASQRVAFAPAGLVRGGDSLGWVRAIGGTRPAARQLDSAILVALDDRGLAGRWVMPAGLVRSFERNRNYATDPYQLAFESLRALVKVEPQMRYPEPLASQLRTMVALEADVRFVFVPVALSFERADATHMRGVLRLALLDARAAEVRWLGDVRGDAAASAAAAFASVAQRVADLFVAP